MTPPTQSWLSAYPAASIRLAFDAIQSACGDDRCLIERANALTAIAHCQFAEKRGNTHLLASRITPAVHAMDLLATVVAPHHPSIAADLRRCRHILAEVMA